MKAGLCVLFASSALSLAFQFPTLTVPGPLASIQASVESLLSAATDGVNFDQIKSNIDSIRSQIPTVEVPNFIKQFTDPIGASSLLSLHRDLVSIPSVTGTEKEVADFLVKYLTDKNFSVETQVVGSKEDGRYNVLAYLGKERKTKVLVTSHIDTVPPFIEYHASGGKIWGRGSNDAKGSVATQIQAVLELVDSSIVSEGDVSLLFVVGEETSGIGMKTANELGLSWDAVIFGEPTELKLATGHKGLTSFTLTTTGTAGHSGYPELGKSAIHMLIPSLNALLNLKLPSSKLLGNTTLNIGQIEGGVANNVIAGHASAGVLVRIAASEVEEIRDLLVKTVQDQPFGDEVELTWDVLGYSPIVLDADVEGEMKSTCALLYDKY
jgi:acetylornithine deacetylase